MRATRRNVSVLRVLARDWTLVPVKTEHALVLRDRDDDIRLDAPSIRSEAGRTEWKSETN